MMEKVKIGIVGAGNIATNAHLPAYQNCKDAEIVAVADINMERAKALAEKFNIPQVYSSVEEMLEKADIDAVDVCTWNCAHAEVTIAAARAGKHVMCEKPLTTDMESAYRMRDEIKKAGVKFLLAVPNRFTPPNMLARELYDKGELGDVYYAKTSYIRRRGTPYGWFTDKKTSGGGPVLDIGVHRIDAAWYLMGNPKPVRISAAVSNRIGDFKTKGVDRWQGTYCDDNQYDTEDFGAGVIHFENGAIMLFEATWALNGPDHSATEICGTKAGLTLDPLTIYGERNGYLSDDQLKPSQEKSMDLEMAHFVECVKNGTETRVPIDQAIELQRMLNGIYDSARLGKEIIL